MKLSERNRNQIATRWAASATDLYGNSTWTKSTVKVRWEDTQIKTVDAQGGEIISNAIVYVGEDMSVGDYLYLGSSASATPTAGSYKIRNFRKTPNLTATDYMRKAVL